MSLPDAVEAPPSRTAPTEPGLVRHLGDIAALCGAMSISIFVGSLVSALAERAAAPGSVALARLGDAAAPVLVVAALAALFGAFAHGLGGGMTRRRRLVAARRRWRAWSWSLHLLWIPLILVMVFGEGWVLLIALMTPVILAGLVWIAAMVCTWARRPRLASYAYVGVAGLAIGLFA